MQSVDKFTPSTTEPVFGSALISPSKSQPSTNMDTSDNEKVIPPAEPVANGQNESVVSKLTINENITNGTSENNGVVDSSAVHANGESAKPIDEVKSAVELGSVTEEKVASPTQPTPVLSVPTDTVDEVSSTAMDTAPPAPVAKEPATTTTTAAVEKIADNAPEAPVATESGVTEVKSKSPRGKAKVPVVAPAPTRQSARGRKPASSSYAEENPSVDETVVANQPESSLSQRTKRQAATLAKDAITASNQANSSDDVNEPEVVPVDIAGDNAVTEEQATASPSPGRKRAAPKLTPTASKKAKGKTSLLATNDVGNEETTNEAEVVQTPPKKARTSAPKKTPEPPTEDYARKLRPRK